jgi:maleylpyruvate isomerase
MTADPRTERVLVSSMLADASARVVRTVDGFHDGDWTAASLLPTWTRAHVVAHLALNAEAMVRALRGLVADAHDEQPRTMYDSDEQRGRDIAELAAELPSEIRGRLLGGATLLREAMDAVPDDQWETRVERTPGGRTMRAAAIPGMRLRELEIHHVDLDAGYTRGQWTPGFAEHLLDAMTKRVDAERAFEVRPLDSERTWVIGNGQAEYAVPVVTGPVADLAWWLTGRPQPDTLSCSRGELPTIEGW